MHHSRGTKRKLTVWDYLEEQFEESEDKRLKEHEDLLNEWSRLVKLNPNQDLENISALDKWKEERNKAYFATLPKLEPVYSTDPRNPKHKDIAWVSCYNDTCKLHHEDKMAAGWHPRRRTPCKWLWFECIDYTCEEHLWDKRTAQHFPGKNDTEIFTMKIIVNGACTQEEWQMCLHEECNLHKIAKIAHGFGPESFLDLGPKQAKTPDKLTPLEPED